MAVHSTMRFAAMGMRPCTDAHPWTNSCTLFYFDVLGKAIMSTAVVFTPLYCVPAFLKTVQNGIDKDEIKDAIISSIRTTMYVSIHISMAIGLACATRAFIGQFKQYSTVFLPTFLGGVGLLCEDRNKWNGAMVMIGNTLLERLLLLVERDLGVPLSAELLTAVFMLSSGALLFLLRLPDFRSLLQNIDSPWFFYPPSVKDASHSKRESALEVFRHHLKATARLAGAGVGLQVARVVLKNLRSPSAVARRLRAFDTYRLGLFLGSYSLLFKGCCWALEWWRGRDAAWHALPSGVVAGLSLRLYPRRLLALMAPTTLIQVLLKWICKKRDIKLKYILLWKYIYVSTVSAYLVHVYFLDPTYTPIWFNTILNSISGGITEKLRVLLLKAWHPANFPAIVGGL